MDSGRTKEQRISWGIGSPQEKEGERAIYLRGDIFWPIVKYREYRACDRYSQYNSLDGISDAAFRSQYVFVIIRQAGYYIDNYNNRKLNYKQLIKYYRLLQNWQKPFTVKIYRTINLSCLLLRTRLGGSIHRVTVTYFRFISKPVDFCSHLVGKNS